jgi:hypothetical protein
MNSLKEVLFAILENIYILQEAKRSRKALENYF